MEEVTKVQEVVNQVVLSEICYINMYPICEATELWIFKVIFHKFNLFIISLGMCF